MVVSTLKLSEYLENPVDLVEPSYRIYRYTDAVYKIVHFPSPRCLVGSPEPKQDTGDVFTDSENDGHSAVSRAKRTVLEIGLCNDWSWFCTFTLDPKKYNRFNLKLWYKDFSQFIRDQRKKYHVQLKYLLVPEMHLDGAWHMHGLFSDAPPLVSFRDRADRGEKLPDRIRNSEYCSWSDYERRFGFNSFGRILNPVAVSFYILKYISKSFDSEALASGVHRYYASTGLRRASLHGSVYGESGYLNSFCQNHYQFCDTGFTKVDDGLDWSFALDRMDGLLPLDDPDPVDYPDISDVMDFIQDRMEGF